MDGGDGKGHCQALAPPPPVGGKKARHAPHPRDLERTFVRAALDHQSIDLITFRSVEIDAGKVIDALAASRLDAHQVSGWQSFVRWIDGIVLWFPSWMSHPILKFILPVSLSIPKLAQPSNEWWYLMLIFVVLHVAFAEGVSAARTRLTNREAVARIPRLREEVERVLTSMRQTILGGTTCRLTILLPRRVKDGEWQLVPVLRSDGIPITNSRRLRVVQNDINQCEAVCGLLFAQDAGALERGCSPSNPDDYCATMLVSKEFMEAAKSFPHERRSPRYVHAVMLRFKDARLGVLAIDHDLREHLLGDNNGMNFEKLAPKAKADHDQRRRCIEAIAEVLPRLSLAPIFAACGVNA